MKILPDRHPALTWMIQHLVLLYIAVVVSTILPLVILELTR